MEVTDEMMAQWEPLVLMVARKFLLDNNPAFEDICQEGRIGLLEAFQRYDPAQAKFITYATRMIRGHIHHYFRGTKERGHDMIRTPGWKREQGYRTAVPVSFDGDEDWREPAVGSFEDRLVNRIAARERLAAGVPHLSAKRRECLLTKWTPEEGRKLGCHYALAGKARKDLRTLIPAAERQHRRERRAATAA